MHAGQAAALEINLAVQCLAAADFHQGRADLVAQLARITLARQIHQEGIETAVAVAAHEQAQLVAVAQGADAGAQLEQLILAGLEQLVARQAVQDVAQVLAGMAALRQT